MSGIPMDHASVRFLPEADDVCKSVTGRSESTPRRRGVLHEDVFRGLHGGDRAAC